jgi:hypothetical protein
MTKIETVCGAPFGNLRKWWPEISKVEIPELWKMLEETIKRVRKVGKLECISVMSENSPEDNIL